jgi:hypothetical protein
MPTIAATVTAFRDRVMLATHAPNVAGVPYSLQRRPDLLDAPITIIHIFIASTAPATQCLQGF